MAAALRGTLMDPCRRALGRYRQEADLLIQQRAMAVAQEHGLEEWFEALVAVPEAMIGLP
jgi:hypothetical protein